MADVLTPILNKEAIICPEFMAKIRSQKNWFGSFCFLKASDTGRTMPGFLANRTSFSPNTKRSSLLMDAFGINMKGVNISSGPKITKSFGKTR